MESQSPYPSLQTIAGLVAWAFLYAPAYRPLNESHPLWPEFNSLSEWFRDKIITQLSLPHETSWEDIYRLSGWLIEEEYEDEQRFWEAYEFGSSTLIEDIDAYGKYLQLSQVKRWIVDRE